jgi:hypothetical protein
MFPNYLHKGRCRRPSTMSNDTSRSSAARAKDRAGAGEGMSGEGVGGIVAG